MCCGLGYSLKDGKTEALQSYHSVLYMDLAYLIAMVLFMPIKDNIIAVYIAGCVGATIFEYLTAMAMIKLFGGSVVELRPSSF